VGESGKYLKLDAEFLGYSTVLKQQFAEHRALISKDFEERLGVLYDAQTALLACLGSIYSRPDREFPLEEVTIKVHRAAICSSVTQGIELVEIALRAANYAQAAALIRQEIEAVEVARGLRQGLQKEGKTPRLKALKHLGKNYGFLSSLAHLSRSPALIEATNILNTGIDPNLNSGLENHMFCLHLVALTGITIDLAELHPFSDTEYMSQQEQLWLQSVCGMLDKKGFLSPKKAPSN
jgi:hypothetical protein